MYTKAFLCSHLSSVNLPLKVLQRMILILQVLCRPQMGTRKKLFAALIITVSVFVLIHFTRFHSTSSNNSPTTVVKIDSPDVVSILRRTPIKETPRRRQVYDFSPTNQNEAILSNEIRYEYQVQVLHVNNQLKTELVSAYFDFRQNRNMIAILGCHNHLYARGVKYYCLTKYLDGREICLSQETSQDLLSSSDENTARNCWSYRFGCTLDTSSQSDLPVSVALSTSPKCDSPKSDWIKIFDSRFELYKTGSSPVKEYNIGVCYQTPLFNAKTLQKEVVIESIERNRAMGAEWFTFYFRENPANEVLQALKQYENEGVLELINMTITDTFQDIRYFGELLTIRDCIYRNMYRVKYLSMTDFDEVIVPKNPSHKNLNEMLKAVDSNNIGSFRFKHVALNVPPRGTKVDFNHTCPDSGRNVAAPMFITHTYSTQPFPLKQYRVGRWKVIVKPQNVDKVGIHSVYGMMSGYVQYSVPVESGALFHYRVAAFIDSDHCSDCYMDNRFNDLTPGLVDTFISRVCGKV